MDIVFKRLTEVNKLDIIALMNHPLLKRHMPLLNDQFTEADCDSFIAGKEKLWAEHGYGPWAFLADGKFVGWGGLQPENGEADLGLVLHPDFWGLGKTLYDKIITAAFQQMGFESVIVLLPLSRRRERVLKRLGFLFEGEVELYGKRFFQYRLHASMDESINFTAKSPTG
ncbi:MAG: GNAT family N-acetyltransferase [Leptolyngbyaceae cyanobacterium MO_188.B28]|nr:GNAT family N-acetyltransferase [Leptolyngbyaceae cyanobacterium MO_188.B28]